jgi:branched-chain amino acid transport system ATP-binding protein
MTSDSILRTEGVTTGYGKNEVIKDVSIKVKDGEAVCIIGPNGAGKSTLLKAITGYLPCWEGSVEFNGEDITDVETHRLIQRGMSIVPQGRVVFPEMTVKEHFDIGAWTLNDEEFEANLERIYELFPRIQERSGQKAKTMSGGEQQMVSLGRALILDPDLIILDEPSLGLAPSLVNETFDLINTIQEAGVSILMVEQNAAKALRNTDRGYVIEMGELAYEGESMSLLENDEVQELYLGG